MCTKILLKDSKIPKPEFNALSLSGAKVLDRSSQRKTPDPEWIPINLWDSVCELDNLDAFEGFASSFEAEMPHWKTFFMDSALRDARSSR